jgi:DHA1 family multidrug resistance protein-like MFS transporter
MRRDPDDSSDSIIQGFTDRLLRRGPTVADSNRPDNRGADTSGSKSGRGRQRISWRRNLYALWAAQLLAIVGFSMRTPFLPFFLGDLGVRSIEAQTLWSGIVNAAGAGVMAISAPIWGTVADRYGRKPMLLRSQFSAFFTIGLMAFATAAWHLLALRLVEGALAGTVTAATALVAVSMPRDRLGFGLGMIQTAVFSGSALGPLLGGYLADAVGYRVTFGISAFMLLAAGFVTLFLVAENFTPIVREAGAPREVSIWKIAAAPALLGLIGAMLAIRFSSAAVQPITPLFVGELAHDMSNAATQAGLAMGVLGLTSAISAVWLGRLGDRRGHRPILLVCMIGSGLVYLPMAASQHPWQLIALEALFGVFAGGTIPAANALVANMTAPERRGAIYGVVAAATSIGGFFGPLIGAGVAAAFGFRFTFVLTGLVLLAVTAAMVVATRRGHHAAEETSPTPA